MKTHDFAREMQKLAKVLLDGPNIDIVSLSFSGKTPTVDGDPAVNLHTLANLAKIDKSQWISLIKENGFMIDLRPRDASRDIIGKILKYLLENPDEMEKLGKNIRRKGVGRSNELNKALDLLIPRQYDKE